MAGEDTEGATEKVKEAVSDGSETKEALTAAAVSAVGALAAAKGPDLVRKVVGATEEKSENQAENLGEKAAEGAKKSLGGPQRREARRRRARGRVGRGGTL
jgi:hypothetical protein